jgi:hypothetical protein
MTPRGWFGRRYPADESNLRHPSIQTKNLSPRRTKKRLIVSQSMVIDVDPNKVRLEGYYQLLSPRFMKQILEKRSGGSRRAAS